MDISWDQDSAADWQARMAGLGHIGLRQSWEFGAMMQRFGVTVGRAVICDAGKPLAAAQVLQRRGLRVIGQGPVWLAPLAPAQKTKVLRRLARHAGASIITPDEHVSGFGLVPLITPKSYAVWNLNAPPDQLRQSLHGKWRNRLLRAEAVVHPRPLSRSQLQSLIAHEARQRLDRNYKNLPVSALQNWAGGVLATGWHSGGALQAGMVFLIYGHHASYFLGWANEAARACFAHGPMLWQAALTLRSQGVKTIDLGDVNSESGAGLARFKLGTGAGIRVAGATCLVLPSALQVTTRRDAPKSWIE